MKNFEVTYTDDNGSDKTETVKAKGASISNSGVLTFEDNQGFVVAAFTSWRKFLRETETEER